MKERKVLELKLLILFIPVLFIFAGMVLFGFLISHRSVDADVPEELEINFKHEVMGVPVSINTDSFFSAIGSVVDKDRIDGCNIRGGVVTHHDLANSLITDFFQQIKNNGEPKTFIIIGPNHTDVGLGPGITGRFVWQTPFSLVENNYVILDEVVSLGDIVYDEDNFISEHSTGALIPYISYYFPEAKIVPIALKSKFGFNESLNLAEQLKKYLDDPSVVLIASIDFSHYLPSSMAGEKDKETLNAITNKDYNEIFSFRDDHLDSAVSMITFLRIMELVGADDLKILQNTNSGEILKQEVGSSTSYFTILFCKH